jgi:hypothetical protein
MDTLAVAPCTVLTNGTLFPPERLAALAALARDARYALELRVSLDGDLAEAHDAIRGPGAFARALDGIERCSAAGLLPIVTVTHALGDDPLAVRARYDALLRAHGAASRNAAALTRPATRWRAYRRMRSIRRGSSAGARARCPRRGRSPARSWSTSPACGSRRISRTRSCRSRSPTPRASPAT